MFWETSLIQTISPHSVDYSNEKETYPKNGRVVTAASPRRRRAASTSIPLKTLTFNSEYLNLDSLLSYLPATPRRFSHHLQWNHPLPPIKIPTAARVAAAPRTSINSLPTELLCLIFDSYLSPSSDESEPDTDDHPNGFFSVSRDYVRTPILLTHVCRQWRHTAIAHRRLWSTITLAIAESDNEQQLETFAKGKIQLLRLFLLRARDTPLSIAFAASTSREDLIFEALQYICRCSHLWKEFKLELDRVRGAEMFLDQLSGVVSRGSNFNALKSLELAVDDDDEESEDEERMLKSRLVLKDIYGIILRRAPNLTDITLDDLFFVWVEGGDYSICPSYEPKCLDDASTDLVPWKQLQNVTITCESISTRKVLRICSDAVNLESLKVWRVGCNGASEVDDHASLDDFEYHPSSCSSSTISVGLPHLRSLDVTLLTEPEQLFSALSLPVLEHVNVDVQSLRGRFPGARCSSLASLLAPIARIVDGVPTADVHCRVAARCLGDPREGLDGCVVGSAWMRANGLRTLTGAGSSVGVYKY